MILSICTSTISGSVVLRKSTVLSKELHCRIRARWLPSNMRDTLNRASMPWTNIMSGGGGRERESEREGERE